MRKICITSFDPFDGRRVNVSREVVNKLDDISIIKENLKVSYNIKPDIERILNNDLDILILTGEAQGRDVLTLEKLAINLKSATRPDNDGTICFNQKIGDGCDAYFSNVDVLELNKKLNDLGYNTKVSLSAGTYVCNLSYYHALEFVKKNNIKTKVLFIHYSVDYTKIDEYVKTTKKIIELI